MEGLGPSLLSEGLPAAGEGRSHSGRFRRSNSDNRLEERASGAARLASRPAEAIAAWPRGGARAERGRPP